MCSGVCRDLPFPGTETQHRAWSSKCPGAAGQSSGPELHGRTHGQSVWPWQGTDRHMDTHKAQPWQGTDRQTESMAMAGHRQTHGQGAGHSRAQTDTQIGSMAMAGHR